MASVTKICNMALSHLGSSKQIANFETERSAEANACREFFEIARDEVLMGYHWPFATKLAFLAKIADDPSVEWGFSYQYPADCLDIRKILSAYRTDTKDTAIKFRILGDDSGRYVYTDVDEAEAEYTVRMTNTERFPEDFVIALSFLLAAYIAARVTAGDPFKKGQQAMQMFMIKLPKAEARSAREERTDRQPESEFILARR